MEIVDFAEAHRSRRQPQGRLHLSHHLVEVVEVQQHGTPVRDWLVQPPVLASGEISQYEDAERRVVHNAAYRTRDGRLGSNFHPGMRYCIAIASSRAPRPFSR